LIKINVVAINYFKNNLLIFYSLIVAGIGDLNDWTIKSGLELISTLVKMIIGDENIYNKNADRIKKEIKVYTYTYLIIYDLRT